MNLSCFSIMFTLLFSPWLGARPGIASRSQCLEGSFPQRCCHAQVEYAFLKLASIQTAVTNTIHVKCAWPWLVFRLGFLLTANLNMTQTSLIGHRQSLSQDIEMRTVTHLSGWEDETVSLKVSSLSAYACRHEVIVSDTFFSGDLPLFFSRFCVRSLEYS